jgi:outer membrane protein OmpA-like peptidoglycan-associated protein
MSETTEIAPIWVQGTLNCSFTTAHFMKDEVHGLTLNHIQPTGRKVLSNAQVFDGVPPARELSAFLEDRYLLGLEVFPLEAGVYPLDMARKFNAEDVHILDPKITEIREVDGVRHGLLEATVYCKLHRLKDVKFNEELKKLKLNAGVPGGANVFNGASNSGCTPNRGCLSAGLPSLNAGCMSSPLQGGCLNLGRIGCGGLISLLLFLGLITLFMRACQRQSADKKDTTEQNDNTKDDSDFFPSDSTENAENRDTDDADDLRRQDNENTSDTVELIETESIVLPNVQFYTNSNRLLPSSAKDLDRLSLYLLEHLECKATIYGHTDNRGNDNFNMRLSQSRANSVRDYLIGKGVDAGRLKAVGKGETEPRASNDSQEGMLMNRRVEIEILSGKKIKPHKKK